MRLVRHYNNTIIFCGGMRLLLPVVSHLTQPFQDFGQEKKGDETHDDETHDVADNTGAEPG